MNMPKFNARTGKKVFGVALVIAASVYFCLRPAIGICLLPFAFGWAINQFDNE